MPGSSVTFAFQHHASMPSHSRKTNLVLNALASLAEDDHLRAISLSGPWGTGKTYLVHQFATKHLLGLNTTNLRFAYVSLFGVQTLADVRSRLAATAIEAKSKGTLGALGKKALLKGLVPNEAYGFDISRLGEIGKELVENATLKNLLICIDDLERAGAGLRPVDVLGLISELTEQRGCKVLLVLNKEKLAEEAMVRLFEEKVFDLNLDFRPHPNEVIHLAISRTADRIAALPIFESFGCANIRVMRRLAWVLKELADVKVAEKELVWPRVVRQSAIFTLLKFERGLSKSDFREVIGRSESALVMRQMMKDEEKEAAPRDNYSELLDSIDHKAEAFDICIADLLHDGSFESSSFRTALEATIAGHKVKTMEDRANALVRETRSGLKLSASELAAMITAFLREDVSKVSRANIAILCDLLAAIDRSADGAEVIRKVMHPIFSTVPVEKRGDHLREFPSLRETGLIATLPYVPSTEQMLTLRQAFDEVAATPDGWNPKFADLARYSDAEIRELLLELDAPDSMFQIRRLRERLPHAEELSEAERGRLKVRIDKILAEIEELDPLFRYKLRHFAAPRKNR